MSKFTLFDDNIKNGTFHIYNNEDKTYYSVAKVLGFVKSSNNSYYPLFLKAFFHNTVTLDNFDDIHLQMPKSIQDWITYLNGFVSSFIEIVTWSESNVGDSLYFLIMRQKVFHASVNLDDGLTLCCGYFQANLDSSDFETDLYPELLDNTETVSNLNLYINGGDVSSVSDRDLAFQKNIELYNANVLALRATKKVNANVSGSISQSGEQQQIDLSPISNGLTNIANKLQRVDENQETKNITQTINDLNLSNQTVITTVEKAPYNPLLDDSSDFDF